MRRRRVPPIGEIIETCDRCGNWEEKSKMTRQKGGLVCPRCYDAPTRLRPRRMNRL